MNVPITTPFLDREEEESVIEVIRSGWVSQGPKVQEFEERFAGYVGSRHAVATTSCTTALHASLVVSGIGEGDEVVVPSLSFIATANAVIHAGGTPVFADINPETCNVTADAIEKVMTDRTKAIIPVHQMGLPADLEPMMDLCRNREVIVIEDAACAIGSEYKGKRIGGHGNLTCFSFHPRKVITTGEGGMITTDDPDIAERLRRCRHHGMSVSDIERHTAGRVIIESYPEIGYNYRMTDMQAAMGCAQLNKLPRILNKRREIAVSYNRKLRTIPHIKVPQVPSYANHNYQSYWIELCESAPLSRNDFMERMLDRGIATRRGIMAIHKEKSYEMFKVDLPETEKIAENTVILPLYPSMTKDDMLYVTHCVEEILQ